MRNVGFGNISDSDSPAKSASASEMRKISEEIPMLVERKRVRKVVEKEEAK